MPGVRRRQLRGGGRATSPPTAPPRVSARALLPHAFLRRTCSPAHLSLSHPTLLSPPPRCESAAHKVFASSLVHLAVLYTLKAFRVLPWWSQRGCPRAHFLFLYERAECENTADGVGGAGRGAEASGRVDVGRAPAQDDRGRRKRKKKKDTRQKSGTSTSSPGTHTHTETYGHTHGRKHASTIRVEPGVVRVFTCTLSSLLFFFSLYLLLPPMKTAWSDR